MADKRQLTRPELVEALRADGYSKEAELIERGDPEEQEEVPTDQLAAHGIGQAAHLETKAAQAEPFARLFSGQADEQEDE